MKNDWKPCPYCGSTDLRRVADQVNATDRIACGGCSANAVLWKWNTRHEAARPSPSGMIAVAEVVAWLDDAANNLHPEDHEEPLEYGRQYAYQDAADHFRTIAASASVEPVALPEETVTAGDGEEMSTLKRLATSVCKYDWSDNDEDAVACIDELRRYLEALAEIEKRYRLVRREA